MKEDSKEMLAELLVDVHAGVHRAKLLMELIDVGDRELMKTRLKTLQMILDLLSHDVKKMMEML